MRALLVHPRFPSTYWGLQYGLRLIGKGTLFPPLGLLTVAALLPQTWELRLVDLNFQRLTAEDLEWAEVVLCGGMLIQTESMNEVIARAHGAGRRVVIGGPAPTTAPELFSTADIIFQGEAEGRADELIGAIEHPTSTPVVLATPGGYPDMSHVPVPRFDLLNARRYGAMSVQFSRGCPYHCEFCDIVELFGKAPRVKSPEQILAELTLLHARAHRGIVFLVDDNFIGNRPAVMRLLPQLIRWQEEHGYPFELLTEASVTLAADPELTQQMVRAGFTGVFLGIETPSEEALEAANKKQNLRMGLSEVVGILTRAGLEVMGGFIVGFDSDDAHIFAAQRDFIMRQPIPFAMVGLLSALPGTILWKRMQHEGRLRSRSTGDQFDRPNFEPKLEERALLQGYAWLMKEIYSPEAYYARCEQFVRQVDRGFAIGKLSWQDLSQFLRIALHVGVLGENRLRFWRLAAQAATRGTRVFHTAIAHALHGEHLIRYTRDDVLPRLEEAIRGLPEPALPGLAVPKPVSKSVY